MFATLCTLALEAFRTNSEFAFLRANIRRCLSVCTKGILKGKQLKKKDTLKNTNINMSGVEEILSYKKNPAEDFYALLNCNENSSVSSTATPSFFHSSASNFPLLAIKFEDFPGAFFFL